MMMMSNLSCTFWVPLWFWKYLLRDHWKRPWTWPLLPVVKRVQLFAVQRRQTVQLFEVQRRQAEDLWAKAKVGLTEKQLICRCWRWQTLSKWGKRAEGTWKSSRNNFPPSTSSSNPNDRICSEPTVAITWPVMKVNWVDIGLGFFGLALIGPRLQWLESSSWFVHFRSDFRRVGRRDRQIQSQGNSARFHFNRSAFLLFQPLFGRRPDVTQSKQWSTSVKQLSRCDQSRVWVWWSFNWFDVVQVKSWSYEELDAVQHKKIRQLSLLEMTVLMDQHGLDPGRKRRNRRKIKGRLKSEGALYGLTLNQLVAKDRSIQPAIKTPFVMDTVSCKLFHRVFASIFRFRCFDRQHFDRQLLNPTPVNRFSWLICWRGTIWMKEVCSVSPAANRKWPPCRSGWKRAGRTD